jgi:hypothetical protein
MDARPVALEICSRLLELGVRAVLLGNGDGGASGDGQRALGTVL